MNKEIPLTQEELLSCLELGKALTSELGSKRLFQKILQKISELLPAENWALLLCDEKTGELHFEVSVDLDMEVAKDVCLEKGEGIAGQVALTQKPMIVEDVSTCEFFIEKVDKVSGFKTRSIVCVPLIFRGKTLGVIEVVNPISLGQNAISLLTIIADYAAIAVENMRHYQKIHHLAIHDELTGLYNTRYLYQKLIEMTDNPDGPPYCFSLIFMDLDNFKHVVDTYGHLKGSRTIREVARTIDKCLDPPAFGVAYGGDEFVVVLPEFDHSSAIKMIEKIQREMRETAYLSKYGYQVPVRASFGLATYPFDAADVNSLLALADQAMFDTKAGRKTSPKS